MDRIQRWMGWMVATGLALQVGCAAPTWTITPDEREPEAWPAAEAEMLTNIRQLTSSDMGLKKSGEAYFSPDMRKIIFQAFVGDATEYQEFTLDLDESGAAMTGSLKQVSPGGGACTCGYFRPDGKKIIYGSSYLNPDTPNPNVYHREGSNYTWNMPGGMDVIEADVDGSNPRQLTTVTGYDAECGYSPSGETIVFCSDRDGDPDLYIMTANGEVLRQLTNEPGYDGGPFFSPEGQRVIFRADRNQDDHLQLFVINSDGTGERQLTPHGSVVRWAPYWLPDGRSVVYTTSIHGHRNYEVYLLNIDTGLHRRVTFSPGFDGLPVVSADGKKMMWTSQRDPTGSSQIFIADLKIPEGY